MNEMTKFENGDIVVAEEVIKELKKFQKAKLKMDLMQEQLKEEIKNAMEKYGKDKWISPDGSIVVNYISETTSKRLDQKRLKEEQEDIYNQYLKDTTTKSYVKLVVK